MADPNTFLSSERVVRSLFAIQSREFATGRDGQAFALEGNFAPAAQGTRLESRVGVCVAGDARNVESGSVLRRSVQALVTARVSLQIGSAGFACVRYRSLAGTCSFRRVAA
jgi:hypothetical protein